MKLRMVATCILCTLLLGASSAFAELDIEVKTGGSEANMANWSAYYYGKFEVGTDINWKNLQLREDKAKEIAENGYKNAVEIYGKENTTNHTGIRNYGTNDVTMSNGDPKTWFPVLPDDAEIIGVWNGNSKGNPSYNYNLHDTNSQEDSYNLGGFYAFAFDFSLQEAASNVMITGNFWMDNSVFAVELLNSSGDQIAWLSWLNGGINPVSVNAGDEFKEPLSFGKGLGDLEAGEYSLVFYGMNGFTYTSRPTDVSYTCGPMGFVADLQIKGGGGTNQSGDATPEPATLLMLGLGGLVLPLSRRFRKK